MKKILAMLLVFVLLCGLCACGDESSDNLIIENVSATGAAFDMSLEQFSEKFDSIYNDVEKPLKFKDVEFTLNDCWGEPELETDESDIEFDYYTATVNDILMVAWVYDGKVADVFVDFKIVETDELEFASLLTTVAIMTCSDLEFEKAQDVYESAINSSYAMDYIDGIMYYYTDSDCVIIRAATDSYVQSCIARGSKIRDDEYWNTHFEAMDY